MLKLQEQYITFSEHFGLRTEHKRNIFSFGFVWIIRISQEGNRNSTLSSLSSIHSTSRQQYLSRWFWRIRSVTYVYTFQIFIAHKELHWNASSLTKTTRLTMQQSHLSENCSLPGTEKILTFLFIVGDIFQQLSLHAVLSSGLSFTQQSSLNGTQTITVTKDSFTYSLINLFKPFYTAFLKLKMATQSQPPARNRINQSNDFCMFPKSIVYQISLGRLFQILKEYSKF